MPSGQPNLSSFLIVMLLLMCFCEQTKKVSIKFSNGTAFNPPTPVQEIAGMLGKMNMDIIPKLIEQYLIWL